MTKAIKNQFPNMIKEKTTGITICFYELTVENNDLIKFMEKQGKKERKYQKAGKSIYKNKWFEGIIGKRTKTENYNKDDCIELVY